MPKDEGMNVCHLTSAHPRFDIRIFKKECRSLAKVYHTTLVVADGLGAEDAEGVHIVDVGKADGRLARFYGATNRVLKKALALDADLYHLHDPELLRIAMPLLKRGKLVVFDAHEDFPKQLLSKPYLAPSVARMMSKMADRYERRICPKLTAIVSATPYIAKKFSDINKRSVAVNNFPLLTELQADVSGWSDKEQQFCYVGGITKIRGIESLVAALSHLPGEGKILKLAGKFSETATLESVKKLEGFSRVEEMGFLNRGEVKTLLARSLAGVVTFLPFPNHVDAQPNKMFEYMSAGIPVIASHFPLWRDIIEGNACGLCVDPEDPESIAKAMQYLIDHREEAERMGANGRKAVEEQYNWEQEEKVLLSLYRELEQDFKAGR